MERAAAVTGSRSALQPLAPPLSPARLQPCHLALPRILQSRQTPRYRNDLSAPSCGTHHALENDVDTRMKHGQDSNSAIRTEPEMSPSDNYDLTACQKQPSPGHAVYGDVRRPSLPAYRDVSGNSRMHIRPTVPTHSDAR